MIKVFAQVSIQLAALLMCLRAGTCAEIVDLAQSCRQGSSGECHLLYVQDGRVMFRPAGAIRSRDVGPYLTAFSVRVNPGEAPVEALHLPGNRTVLVAWGFEPHFRAFGPAFSLYFLDSDGRVVLRAPGDVIMRCIRVGRLLGGKSVFVAVTLQSESAIAVLTKIWLWGTQGDPRKVLDQSGRIERFETGPIPGVRITSAVSLSERTQWRTDFYVWHDDASRFVSALSR